MDFHNLPAEVEADWLVTEIEAGIETSASIGSQGAVSRSADPKTGQPVRTIIPDISFVPLPADKGPTHRRTQVENEDIVVEATGTSALALDTEQLFRAAKHTAFNFPWRHNNTGNWALA